MNTLTKALICVLIAHKLIASFSSYSNRRLDFQARPNPRGASAFRHLLARLPPRAHSIYYRDDIGNISTSEMQSDSKKVYILDLRDLVFQILLLYVF